MNIDETNEKHRPECLALLEEFDHMWEGHLKKISTTRLRIELTGNDICPLHSELYREGPTTRQFVATEIDWMLKEEVTDPAITEWASPIVFAFKKDGSLRFCIDYKKAIT